MDGAAEQVDTFLDWAAARDIGVMIDVHGLRGSENGYDNSGHAQDIIWNEEGT
jgi:glucan 1,3-beta-glucosidase